ncbi:hypothetical protein M885DRAFT_139438 [Pelagophyceae sp. CCMP2097]|nr:hypothetical protein M885DRAFT_139438 [Pelagophyceae sp. CCMP2097]
MTRVCWLLHILAMYVLYKLWSTCRGQRRHLVIARRLQTCPVPREHGTQTSGSHGARRARLPSRLEPRRSSPGAARRADHFDGGPYDARSALARSREHRRGRPAHLRPRRRGITLHGPFGPRR